VPAARRGGGLVHATCTLLAEESEDVVAGFRAAHPELRIEPALEVLGRQGLQVLQGDTFLRLFPHRPGTDGFFAAVMVRACAAA
jgi:16S rRNA (cytosine967-C5)-methyltransferase